MDVWVTLLAALGPALARALYDVGKEVVKPLMGPATERFEAWARRRYDAKVDDARVRDAIEIAAQAAAPAEREDWAHHPLISALDRLAGRGQDALRRQTLAAALAMTDDAPEQVPRELLRALRVPESRRADLAHFLWAFRRALAQADDDYRALVELAGADEARALLRRLASAVTGVAGEPALRVRPVPPEEREIEARYLRSLVESECRFLPLGERDPRASATAGLPMHLERVYIALKTTERPPEAREERGPSAESAETARAESISALRVFLDHPCLVLLGEPGSGKTTFADHLALCLAGERWEPKAGWAGYLETHDAAWEGPALLPIRVRLRDFAADLECLPADSDERGRAEHLLAYVERALRAGRYGTHLPDHALACLDRGDGLLILDGLDEVGDPARREQVAHAIADLARRRCPRARLLVTCRVRQYPLDAAGRPAVDWALPGFHVTTLADFDGAQIDGFIDAWFSELCALGRFSERVRDQKTTSLREAIGLRPDLQEIAPRPILLAQMALVHDIEGELPGTRVQLYAECADLLLWKWEQLRAERAGRRLTAEGFIRERMGVPGLHKEDLQRALDHAVFDAHGEQGAAGRGPTNIPEETLRKRLAECLVRTGLPDHQALGKAQLFVHEYLRRRNGLIVPAGEHTFQTPHRTIQEFLAARWLQLQRGFDREAPRLVQRDYDLWREVFLLAVGQARLGDAVDAVDVLCPAEWPEDEGGWRRLILAGQGLNEIGLPKVRGDERGPEVERRIVRFLQRTMQDTDRRGRPCAPPRVPVPTRYAAGEVLDRLWLPDDLDAWVEVEIPSAKSQTPKRIYVGRYPVTNHQFARFIAVGGYENPEYWGGEESAAWRWRIGEPRYDWRRTDAPDRWDSPRFGKSRRGYPVVGVCWYEAVAYCAWLTEQLQVPGFTFRVWRDGKLEALNLQPGTLAVRLPTEEEWVAAAGGEKGGRYPWGPKWHESHANTGGGGVRGTTPVAMYPSGQSPHGVWDMGGNVWEWMGSWYDEEHRRRALRGGSWSGNRELARVRVRGRNLPGSSNVNLGFRVVASPAGAGS
jgi:formylglycine-generating enzyme required for sulfatase activity